MGCISGPVERLIHTTWSSVTVDAVWTGDACLHHGMENCTQPFKRSVKHEFKLQQTAWNSVLTVRRRKPSFTHNCVTETGDQTAPPPPVRGGSGDILASSPSKRFRFSNRSLVKANSGPFPESPSANSESPLLNSKLSLGRVSEDKVLDQEAAAYGDMRENTVRFRLESHDCYPLSRLVMLHSFKCLLQLHAVYLAH